MATKERQELAAVVARRLKQLVETSHPERFAHDLDVGGRTSVLPWLNGTSVPGGESLRAIAELTGVTVGWLLGVAGEPQYRDQERTAVALEADVAAYVGRMARAAVRDDMPHSLAVRVRLQSGFDGPAILQRAIESEVERVRREYTDVDVKSILLRTGQLADENERLKEQLERARPKKRRARSARR